jgi:flagellar basal body-associated protein FliL
MAAEAVKENKDAHAGAPEADAADAPRRRSKKPLLIALVVVFVAVGQGVITYFLLPAVSGEGTHGESAKADPSHGETAPKDDHGGHDNHGDHGGHGGSHSASATVEVSVGEFVCSNGSASPGSILHVTCRVFAITAGNQSSTLESQLNAHQARVRQAVAKILRSSNLEELHDPNMGTVKRLIREELNRLMKKSLVMEIVITDIRVIEQ